MATGKNWRDIPSDVDWQKLLLPGCPKKFQQLIAGCFEKSPKKRLTAVQITIMLKALEEDLLLLSITSSRHRKPKSSPTVSTSSQTTGKLISQFSNPSQPIATEKNPEQTTIHLPRGHSLLSMQLALTEEEKIPAKPTKEENKKLISAGPDLRKKISSNSQTSSSRQGLKSFFCGGRTKEKTIPCQLQNSLSTQSHTLTSAKELNIEDIDLEPIAILSRGVVR